MLDFMRRHAEGWGIKLLLGFISLSFVLFFGYSAYQSRPLSGQTAAQVGDMPIPLAQYNQAYNNSVQQLQGQFQEGIPENFLNYLRANILEQLIQRGVQVQFAQSLGFQVSDLEVAQAIRKQPQFQKEGVFDANYYKTQFRPFYRERFGVDYEQALRQDLLTDQLNSFQNQSMLLPAEWQNWTRQRKQESWTFEIISIPDQELKDSFKDTEDPDTKIKELLQAWLEQWKKGEFSKVKLKKYGAIYSENKVNFLDKTKLLKQKLPEEYARGLFGFNKAPAIYPQPIKLKEQWFLLRLKAKTVDPSGTSQTDAKEETNQTEPAAWARLQNEFFNLWHDEFRKNLPIQTNLNF